MPRIIEWEEQPWNPVKGCNIFSIGCYHCYALTKAQKMQAEGRPKYKDGFKLRYFPDLLKQNLDEWPPKRIFAGSMTDFFHKDVPVEIIEQIFKVFHTNPKHLFLMMTKRAERMHEHSNRYGNTPNLLLGVTVEHPDYKHRIRLLQGTNAIIKESTLLEGGLELPL